MCQPIPLQNYSPRVLVAVAVGSDGTPSGGEGGSEPDRGSGSGGGAPTQPYGTPSAAWRNLTQPMPLKRKTRLLVRNIRIRVKTRQQCCGHSGEPGC